MLASTVDLKLNRLLATRLLGLVYPRIYYSSVSPLRVADIPRPVLPAADWVRVRNRLAGICGSDQPLVYANTDFRTSIAARSHTKPIYPGHEVVGEVIEIGENVQHLRVGDRVALQYNPNCLSNAATPICHACMAGNYNLCEYGPLPGPQPIGGGWSEEMLCHEQQLFRLPIELSDEQGVILEPTAVALHGVLRHLPQAGDTVLIIGAGSIGLLTLQILRVLVPNAQISVLARYPFQIEYATRLGADHIIYPTNNPYASIQRATHSGLSKGLLGNRVLLGGYDVIYHTIGQRNTLHHALRWLRSQGTMVLIGLNLHMMFIDPTPIWRQEINLLGSSSHGREIWSQEALTNLLGTPSGHSTFTIVTELMRQKRIHPEQLITHRFALNNYQEALVSAYNKKNSQSIKVLFDYSLLPVSTVPNIRASARVQHPSVAQPQGDAFIEEVLNAENAIGSHQDLKDDSIPQPNRAQPTMPPKILDTPPPHVFPKESWHAILDAEAINEEDTDAAIPVIKPHPPMSPMATETPQTPMPPAEESSIDQPIQPPLDDADIPTVRIRMPVDTAQQLEKYAHTPAVPQTELPADISVQPEDLEPQEAEAVSAIPSFTNSTALEPPTNETESTTLFPETTGIHTLSEEQLPTQTVLDNLFDADPSSPPEFLAQLSDFGGPALPEMPAKNVEAPSIHDTSTTILPVEEIEAPIPPDTPNTTKPIDIAEAPTLHDMPTEKTEAITSPDATTTKLPIENVEAPISPNPSSTTIPTEDVEAPISSYAPLPILPIESAEALFSSDPSNATKNTENTKGQSFHDMPTEKMKALTSPDTTTARLPIENVEAPPRPDTSTALPLDLPDQITANLIDTSPTLPKLKAKRRRKASQLARTAISMRKDNQQEKKHVEERLTQETQPEQAATQPTQEQSTPDSDNKTE